MPIRPWKNGTATVLPAWESMNDQQLDRNLRSVGREIFVAYFTEFCDRSRSNEDVAAQIEEERGYTDKSCRSRTSHARSIIGAGRPTILTRLTDERWCVEGGVQAQTGDQGNGFTEPTGSSGANPAQRSCCRPPAPAGVAVASGADA